MGKLHRTLLIVRLNFLDWKRNPKIIADLSWHSHFALCYLVGR